MGQLQSLLTRYRRRRFAILFYSLLLTLVGRPLLDALFVEVDLVVFLTLNLLAVIASSVVEGRWRVIAALAFLFVAMRAIYLAAGVALVLSASEAFWALGSLLACAAMLRFVLRRGVVDSERIYAALGVYLLAGLVFGVAYHTMERVWPGSLRLASPESPNLTTSIYFSFVTLATLGYGDIVPASTLARAVATVEAVGAQLYLAVLIARLVSLQSRESDGDRSGE